MSSSFYSNDILVKIRTDGLMAEAEAYRRATEVEQSHLRERPTRRRAFHRFGWIRRLVLRIGGVAA